MQVISLSVVPTSDLEVCKKVLNVVGNVIAFGVVRVVVDGRIVIHLSSFNLLSSHLILNE